MVNGIVRAPIKYAHRSAVQGNTGRGDHGSVDPLIGGQSLAVQLTNANAQRTKFNDAFHNNGSPNTKFYNAAVGGTNASDKSGASADMYWWDTTNNKPGQLCAQAIDNTWKSNVRPTCILFDLGQTDAGDITVSNTEAVIKDAMLKTFEYMRSILGPVNVYLVNMGQLNPGANEENGAPPAEGEFQKIKKIVWELRKEYRWIRAAHENWDKTRQDKFHIEIGDERASASERAGLSVIGQELEDSNVNYIGPTTIGCEISGSNRVLLETKLEAGTDWHADMNHFSNGQCNFDELAGYESIVQVFKNDVRLEPNSIRHYDGSQESSFDHKFRIDFNSGTFTSSDKVDVYVGYDWCGSSNGDGTYKLLQTVRSSQSNLIKDDNDLPLRQAHWQRLANESNFVRMSSEV